MARRNEIARTAAAVVLWVAATSCAGAINREALRPIPELPPSSSPSDVRGTEQAAARLAGEQQLAIITEVVRRFYRPLMGQARWIDPQRLAHRRTRSADSAMAVDEDWAIAIVTSVAVRRVCPLTEANAQCRGLPGGVLRFSSPYAVASDSAVVFARYTPIATTAAAAAGEIEFRVVRRNGVWYLANRRTVAMGGGPFVASAALTSTEELLAADRSFAQAAAQTDLVSGLANMFAFDVIMQTPNGHVRGRTAVVDALRTNPDNPRSRAEWTPIRVGTASDGQHGFTFGYMTITRQDGEAQSAKYLAYWVKQANGWRVMAYKRVPRAAGNVSLALLPPSVPTSGLARGDSAMVRRHADELRSAEIAFSNDATPMGLGPAFLKWGAPDAAFNAGPNSSEFVRGPLAISKVVGSVAPGGSISWTPTDVVVASTGDLGVSIGTIRITRPAAADRGAETREVAFFTVWKRATPHDAWRYVAE